ncbi:MAG: bifunctional methylenetetrahydrofolate dehydrogenase/methenyltetrahydrofolate cyclohydrolase, partial [Magnetococcales bacterium]|nr:bifunctional methylenetetrahydrofolate dehydrogenase/methenyltetrahydrofolate cyclohydrolase [Magnetococcales bacterium]
MAHLIDGKQIANDLRENLRQEVLQLRGEHGV